jgi:hypothetical protein
MRMRTILFSPSEGFSALGLAAGLAILYVNPVLPSIAEPGLDWPIASSQGEGVSLSVYGKWWVLTPHYFLTDAYSGDLATFFQFLSGSVRSLIAALLGVPNLTTQSTIYAPLLGFLLFLLTYLPLVPVVDREEGRAHRKLVGEPGGKFAFLVPVRCCRGSKPDEFAARPGDDPGSRNVADVRQYVFRSNACPYVRGASLL